MLGKEGCWIDGKGFVPLENIFKTDFNNILQVYWIFFIMSVGVIGSIFLIHIHVCIVQLCLLNDAPRFNINLISKDI